MKHRILLEERLGPFGEILLELFIEFDGQIYRNVKGLMETDKNFPVKEERKMILGKMFVEIGKMLEKS